MKKLNVLFLSLVIGLFFCSCEKAGTDKQESEFDFSIMGKMHNDGLEVIFSGLQEVGSVLVQSQAKDDPRATYIATIKSQSIAYVQQETNNNAEAVSVAKDLLSKFLDEDNPEYSKYQPIDNSIYTPYVRNIKFSATFNSKLKELNTIATDRDVNLQSLLSRLQQLASAVKGSSMNTNEQNILLAGISVAYESYQYWYDKGPE
ncbi:MAG: hypothetical protein NC324_07040 [Bacteroides sp.]|nr:hypothetical protein [Bacteroides sp.]